MKGKLLLAAIAIAFSATLPALAEDAKQDFQLINKTGYELNKVYVSPSKSDDWEDDVLGRDTLSDGDHVEIKFHRADKTCHWDLKVVYTIDGSNAVWSDIDLCSVEKITIHYNKSSDTTTATYE
jgi:hypothetical protein